MAKVLEVQSCCGCSSLRTGTIIIGIIQIIISSMMVIMTYAVDIRWEEALPGVGHNTAKIIYTTKFCITIFIGALLLVGVFKRNTCMMWPWLVMWAILIQTVLINLICKLIASVDNPRDFVLSLFGGLTMLLIYWDLWRVVYSHFQELRNDERNGGNAVHEGPPSYPQYKLEAGQN